MPLSKNLNTYYDVAQVLLSLRDSGGGFYDFAEPGLSEAKAHGRAVMWRARAYYYRSLLSKAAREKYGNVPGYVAETDWDDMFITVVGTCVSVEFGKLRGHLTTFAGETIEPVKPAVRQHLEPSSAPPLSVTSDIDVLELEAEKLKRKLDGGK